MSRSGADRRRSRTPQPAPSRPGPDWRWRSFPVFVAFMAGLLVAALVNGQPETTPEAILVWVAIIGCSLGAAHYLTMRWYVPRRRRAARARDADAYEDVVVYPDEPAGR